MLFGCERKEPLRFSFSEEEGTLLAAGALPVVLGKWISCPSIFFWKSVSLFLAEVINSKDWPELSWGVNCEKYAPLFLTQ